MESSRQFGLFSELLAWLRLLRWHQCRLPVECANHVRNRDLRLPDIRLVQRFIYYTGQLSWDLDKDKHPPQYGTIFSHYWRHIGNRSASPQRNGMASYTHRSRDHRELSVNPTFQE